MPRRRNLQIAYTILFLCLLTACQGQQSPAPQKSATAPVPADKQPAPARPTSTASVLPLQGSVRPTEVPYCKSFSDTSFQVCNEFLTQWEFQGGLLRYGMPLSGWFYEVDSSTGETYRVQYFERHVIRLLRGSTYSAEPAWSTAPKVPLGSMVYKRKYPNGAPGQVGEKSGLTIDFGSTWLGGRFSEFWRNPSNDRFMDGAEWFGMPISNVFTETSELDGREYTVQYFEQAVLELHPDKPPPDDVQFAPLGLYEFRHRYPNGVPSNPTPTPRPYATPEPGLGCYRNHDLPQGKSTPAVSLAQAESIARAHYSQANNGRALGPLVFSKYVNVDISGPQSDIAIFRDAWHITFLTDAPTPTPRPTSPAGLWCTDWVFTGNSIFVDAQTAQVLPGCEWEVAGMC